MCGLFAYAGPGPDTDLLSAIAFDAGRRGPHGHGWVVAGDRGEVWHAPGPLIAAHVGRLAAAAQGARAVLGHARLATQGAAYDDPAGLQPFGRAGHWLAHNGNVYNPAELAAGVHATDSAAVLAAYAAARDELGPAGALTRVLERAQTAASAVVVLDSDGTLLAARRKLPLFAAERPDGVYLSSRTFPGASPMFPGVRSWPRAAATQGRPT
jgi:asparagine synthetase B (glutamine-hydrolysing)